MNKKLGIIVIDGFGVGTMPDVKKDRPNDIGANTALDIIKENPNIKIPNLEKLGLMNAIGEEFENHLFSSNSNWGKSLLEYKGADTYLGHQEIAGSKPFVPKKQPFNEVIDVVEFKLKQLGYKVERFGQLGRQLLIVNDYMVVADNLEADFGKVYNITATLDKVTFSMVKQLGKEVRKLVSVSRVIACGGKNITIEKILSSTHVEENKYFGVSEPQSGVYNYDYKVVHFGLNVKAEAQIPSILIKNKIDVSLIGKTADIIQADTKRKFPGKNTNYLLDEFLRQSKEISNGFIFMNIQETDLAGHTEETLKYSNLLESIDKRLPLIESLFTKNDLLIITSDHGNDPTNGSSHHTREVVPILIYSPNIHNKHIGERQSLSDIAATVAEYFQVKYPENGDSFLNKLL